MKAIIIDDEPLAIDLLLKYSRDSRRVEVVATFTDPMEGLSYLKGEEVELVFLDIQMNSSSGLELAQHISKDVNIVFTTAHREFAHTAFDLNASDYLLKPISFARFEQSLDKIGGKQGSSPGIVIRANRMDHFLSREDILYLEGLKDYVKVHTRSGVLVSRGSIGVFLRKEEFSFLKRIHRSFAVNPDVVTARSNDFYYVGEHELPIGKSATQRE